MAKLNQNQIDNYHSGRMSESEMTDFERMLESDPAFKAESDLQSDIVSGLKEYRKLELKSRLDAINISSTWVEFVQQSTLLKSLGGIILISVIGTGIYFYGEEPETMIPPRPITVEVPETESIEFVWGMGEEEANSTARLEKPQKAEVSEPTGKTVKLTTPEAAKSVSETEEQVKKEAFKPDFEAPNLEFIEDESGFTATGLDKIPESKVSANASAPIDVQTEISTNDVIRYKYYDGKLFLNGDFDKAPYEILEIISSNGRRIYVYYLGSYYMVGIADKLTDLPEVKDTDALNELKLLRENK